MCHYDLYHATKHKEKVIIMLKTYLPQQYDIEQSAFLQTFRHCLKRSVSLCQEINHVLVPKSDQTSQILFAVDILVLYIEK